MPDAAAALRAATGERLGSLEAILANTPRERSGGAGAIISTARLLGQTTGTALVALIFGLATASTELALSSQSIAILLAAGFAAGAAVVSSLRLMGFERPAPPV